MKQLQRSYFSSVSRPFKTLGAASRPTPLIVKIRTNDRILSLGQTDKAQTKQWTAPPNRWTDCGM